MPYDLPVSPPETIYDYLALKESWRSQIARSQGWLLAGIRAYRQDRHLMQLAHWLKYRLDMWDTSLSQEDIAALEAELGYAIDFSKDEKALDLARHVIDTFNAEYGRQPGDETPPADEENQP